MWEVYQVLETNQLVSILPKIEAPFLGASRTLSIDPFPVGNLSINQEIYNGYLFYVQTITQQVNTLDKFSEFKGFISIYDYRLLPNR